MLAIYVHAHTCIHVGEIHVVLHTCLPYLLYFSIHRMNRLITYFVIINSHLIMWIIVLLCVILRWISKPHTRSHTHLNKCIYIKHTCTHTYRHERKRELAFVLCLLKWTDFVRITECLCWYLLFVLDMPEFCFWYVIWQNALPGKIISMCNKIVKICCRCKCWKH